MNRGGRTRTDDFRVPKRHSTRLSYTPFDEQCRDDLCRDDDDEPARPVHALDPVSSMSLVADGPETSTIGRRSRALGSSAAISSGTDSTIASARITQTWRSGTRLSARRPWPGPPSSAIVPGHGAAGCAGRQRAVERVELARRQTPRPRPARRRSGRNAAIEVARDADAPRSCSDECLGQAARSGIVGDHHGRPVVAPRARRNSSSTSAGSSSPACR